MGRTAGSASPVQGLAARQSAVAALDAILAKGNKFDAALDGVLDAASHAQDRSLVRAIVTISLRRKGQIDDAISRFVTRPLPARSGITKTILRAAVAQLLFMRIPPHAAIDLAVRQAQQDRNAKHFAGLVNAVLRKISAAQKDLAATQDAARLNTPAWLLKRWQETYGGETAGRIAAAHLTEPPHDVSVKSAVDAPQWAIDLGGELLPGGSIRIAGAKGRIEDMPGYGEGAWWVQDVAAALPMRLLGDVKGLRVLDLCAAPGGKTAQLAAAGAIVTAVDNSKSRLPRLTRNLQRLHLQAEIIHGDATAFRSDTLFDAVIADAPCSATGTIRRHPELPWFRTPEHLLASRPLQAAVLRAAIDLTRQGGRIIYCTCSLEPEEGIGQIEDLLREGCPVVRQPVTADEVFGLDHLVSKAGDMRSLPCHSPGLPGGMDGFFAARLIKS